MSAVNTATNFYNAFAKMDADTMASLYAPDAKFSDEVFTNLDGVQAGQMWKMLCTRSKDLKVTYEVTSQNGDEVHVLWHAHYTFSKTGRKVHNVIDATLKIKDGKITEHRDKFNFWKWSIQALGFAGLVLGWTPVVKGKVQKEAASALQSFSKKI